jgi:DNA-binding response OmpR family regulator
MVAHILVVDDDPMVRDVFDKTLKRAGYTVSLVEDGSLVDSILDNQTVDLVITDIVMPRKEGIETIIDIRNAHPDIPIIGISGGGRMLSSKDYLNLAKGIGVTMTLKKPIEPAELIEAVRSCLDR